MTKVGTELLQAFETMKNAFPDNMEVWFISANFGSVKNTLEDVSPIMESLKEAGFTADKEEVSHGQISQDFYLKTNGSSWKFRIGLRWKATEADKLRHLLAEQAKLQEQLNKLTVKDLDDIPEKEVI